MNNDLKSKKAFKMKINDQCSIKFYLDGDPEDIAFKIRKSVFFVAYQFFYHLYSKANKRTSSK